MSSQGDLEYKKLELFFSEWKEKDRKLAIPEFEINKESNFRIWKWLPLGIAATFFLALWMLQSDEKDFNLEKDMVIIQLIENENQEQLFFIESKSSLDVWEAPSSSLLTEF